MEMNEIDEDSGLLPLDLGEKMEEGQKESPVKELLRLPTKGEKGTLPNILNIPDRNRFVVFGGFPGFLRTNKDNKWGVTEVTELVEIFGGTVQGTEMKWGTDYAVMGEAPSGAKARRRYDNQRAESAQIEI